MDSSAGLFLTFEGIEGAGKSTQVRWLATALERCGRRVVTTFEPGGGGAVGTALRQLLKDPAVWRGLGVSEIYLYAAARAQHLESLILPALADGAVVVCDRYLDSTRAYQGAGRGRSRALIESLHALEPLALRPHRTLLFDLDPALGLARSQARRASATAAADLPGYDDEKLGFFERVRAGFLELAAAEPQRFRIVDAAAAPRDVHHALVGALGDLLPTLAPLDDATLEAALGGAAR